MKSYIKEARENSLAITKRLLTDPSGYVFLNVAGLNDLDPLEITITNEKGEILFNEFINDDNFLSDYEAEVSKIVKDKRIVTYGSYYTYHFLRRKFINSDFLKTEKFFCLENAFADFRGQLVTGQYADTLVFSKALLNRDIRFLLQCELPNEKGSTLNCFLMKEILKKIAMDIPERRLEKIDLMNLTEVVGFRINEDDYYKLQEALYYKYGESISNHFRRYILNILKSYESGDLENAIDYNPNDQLDDKSLEKNIVFRINKELADYFCLVIGQKYNLSLSQFFRLYVKRLLADNEGD